MQTKQSSRTYSMESFYKMLGISRQLVHHKLRRILEVKQQENQIILQVKTFRNKHPKMGSRPLYYSMKSLGYTIDIGVTKFEKLLSKNNLIARKISKYGPVTTDGKGIKQYPNLTNGLVLNNVNHLIVGDITYFWVGNKWYYIFTLKDVYSQRILSLFPSINIDGEACLKALEQMQEQRIGMSFKKTIHHTDNGSQYRYKKYIKALKHLEMKISRAKTCKENGSSEQLNHIVKNMYLSSWKIHSFLDLKNACKELMHLNNHQRAIKQLDYKTPIAFEKYIASLNSNDRPKKKLFDFGKL